MINLEQYTSDELREIANFFYSKKFMESYKQTVDFLIKKLETTIKNLD